MRDDTTPCYVGCCPKCGNACAASVDDKLNAPYVRRDVAQFMKQGLILERKTVQWVRENFKGCDCKRAAKQGELL